MFWSFLSGMLKPAEANLFNVSLLTVNMGGRREPDKQIEVRNLTPTIIEVNESPVALPAISCEDTETAIDHVQQEGGDFLDDDTVVTQSLIKFTTIPHQPPFLMGVTVVTQEQWKKVMGTEPWKGEGYVREGDDYPAVFVSWYDAVAFCKKLSEKLGKTCRLPTEAEWEYACRGGTKTAFSFGDNERDFYKYGWYWDNCPDEQYAHRVAQKLPNPFGLFDMHGNVWEWCSDNDDDCDDFKVINGGSWNDNAFYARSASRGNFLPDRTFYNIGFRVIAEP